MGVRFSLNKQIPVVNQPVLSELLSDSSSEKSIDLTTREVITDIPKQFKIEPLQLSDSIQLQETSEPVTSEPVTSEPVTSEPVTSEPVTSEPVTSEPLTSEPFTSETVTSETVTSEPVTSEPVTSEPGNTAQETSEQTTLILDIESLVVKQQKGSCGVPCGSPCDIECLYKMKESKQNSLTEQLEELLSEPTNSSIHKENYLISEPKEISRINSSLETDYI